MTAPEAEPALPSSAPAAMARRPLLLLAGILLAALPFLYADTAVSLAAIWWRSETYAHGLLVLPVSGYLLWRDRRRLARVALGPDWRGLPVVAALVTLWIAARSAHVLFAEHIAFVALLPALVWALLGARLLRAAAFPLGFLVFAIPLGEGLVPVLQDFTAAFSVRALALSGVPVYQEARYISIPGGEFEVAEACSGIRYLIASLAVGCLYAYLTYRSLWRRLAFIAAAAVVPLLANGLRAYGIILLAYLSGMRLAVGVDHLIYGWVFFGVVMGLLFAAGQLWREPEPARTPPSGEGPAPGADRSRPGSWWGAGLGAAGLLVAGPVGAAWMATGPGAEVTLTLPSGRGSWNGPHPGGEGWKPEFPGAGLVQHTVYRGPGGPVHMLLVHFPSESQGKELVASGNRVYQGRRWRRVLEAKRQVRPGAGGRAFSVRETVMASSSGKRLVWHWFDIGGRRTASRVSAKWWAAWNRLFGGRTDTSLIAVAADYGDRPGPARGRLRAFLGVHSDFLRARGIVQTTGGKGP